jgi:hypothetical protein
MAPSHPARCQPTNSVSKLVQGPGQPKQPEARLLDMTEPPRDPYARYRPEYSPQSPRFIQMSP